MEVPLATICRITGAPPSTVYHRRSRADAPCRRPGPRTAMSDDELLARIRTTIKDSPFGCSVQTDWSRAIGVLSFVRSARNTPRITPMAPPIGGCPGSSQKPTTRGDAHARGAIPGRFR